MTQAGFVPFAPQDDVRRPHGVVRRRRSPHIANIALTLAALLSAAPIAAQTQQGTVSGTVLVEGAQRPLPGAQVTVEGQTTGGTATDASGRFRLTGLTGTTVTLNVRALGYRPADADRQRRRHERALRSLDASRRAESDRRHRYRWWRAAALTRHLCRDGQRRGRRAEDGYPVGRCAAQRPHTRRGRTAWHRADRRRREHPHPRHRHLLAVEPAARVRRRRPRQQLRRARVSPCRRSARASCRASTTSIRMRSRASRCSRVPRPPRCTAPRRRVA